MVAESEDPLQLLARALNQAGAVISRVRQDQAGLPTPCRSWDVRALAEHILHDLSQFRTAASGGRPDWSAAAPGVGGDWGSTFSDQAGGLLAAWHDVGDLDAVIKLPTGEVPATFVVNQQIAEFTVHSWDLARATGQDADLDPEICRIALDWARTALRPEFRGEEDTGQVFGLEVPVAADAPLGDRLAAFFGRNPS
jgi:uncharacterized protein (TIGR03086 family)